MALKKQGTTYKLYSGSWVPSPCISHWSPSFIPIILNSVTWFQRHITPWIKIKRFSYYMFFKSLAPTKLKSLWPPHLINLPWLRCDSHPDWVSSAQNLGQTNYFWGTKERGISREIRKRESTSLSLRSWQDVAGHHQWKILIAQQKHHTVKYSSLGYFLAVPHL